MWWRKERTGNKISNFGAEKISKSIPTALTTLALGSLKPIVWSNKRENNFFFFLTDNRMDEKGRNAIFKGWKNRNGSLYLWR